MLPKLSQTDVTWPGAVYSTGHDRERARMARRAGPGEPAQTRAQSRGLPHWNVQATAQVSSSPLVSGKRKISAPPAAKNTDVNASALPMPKRSAKAPIVNGASALAARPTL